MHVVLTHKYCWPYVRRGTERGMDELARYLLARGYVVTTISTKPNSAPTEVEYAGEKRILHRHYWRPEMQTLRIMPDYPFIPLCWRSLLRTDADVVHSFHFYDAWAALAARRRNGHKIVLQINGAPVPGVSCHRVWPPEGRIFREVLRRVDRRIVCSAFVGRQIVELYGATEVLVIPPPVNVDYWTLGAGPADGRPRLLAVGNFDERHKGVRVLVRAFRLLTERLPDAQLRISGRLSEHVQRELFRDLPAVVRQRIEALGVGQPGDLSREYQRASILVLPSMWEPSGTVMMEAWASGTPVVATNHAGLPEFFGEGVGALFEPLTEAEETQNAEGLVEAMLIGLRLSEQPEVRLRCREHAQRFSSETLGKRVEEVYRSL